jgi:hypothetical protein
MKLVTVWSVIAFAGCATAQSCNAFVSSVPSCAVSFFLELSHSSIADCGIRQAV